MIKSHNLSKQNNQDLNSNLNISQQVFTVCFGGYWKLSEVGVSLSSPAWPGVSSLPWPSACEDYKHAAPCLENSYLLTLLFAKKNEENLDFGCPAVSFAVS